LAIERLNDFREIGKRPGEPVYLIDDYGIDLAGGDILQKGA
jgi:hypothetical protein